MSPTNQIAFADAPRSAVYPNGFYNFFKDAMRKAELPESLALHGLRKAFCCHLSDAGVEGTDIATISGQMTLGMVQKYIASISPSATARPAQRERKWASGCSLLCAIEAWID